MESATSRSISRATSKRTTTCDLRPATNRRSQVTRQQNEQQPATCDQSQVADRAIGKRTWPICNQHGQNEQQPATCDLRPATNRRSQVIRQQNEQQPATCDQSQIAR
ncbi:hypothetical protein F2Q69_00032709 [Brassica cretica]|uniref:Uncharacterized protein n=1 Tax=Brassica cretica TaxID=69181 RepID=A0A8S9SPE9_BRACR|nr:hypothetical protein F2Q69_00032709 [Brassica cretica]